MQSQAAQLQNRTQATSSKSDAIGHESPAESPPSGASLPRDSISQIRQSESHSYLSDRPSSASRPGNRHLAPFPASFQPAPLRELRAAQRAEQQSESPSF